jgi:hypothetical protein
MNRPAKKTEAKKSQYIPNVNLWKGIQAGKGKAPSGVGKSPGSAQLGERNSLKL